MKQLTRKVTKSYTYRWWRDDGKAIKESHVEALDEAAIEHITEQMQHGYKSGELADSIRRTECDGEDGISYSGWWETT